MKVYNKLVRDKILKIIKKSGSPYKYHIAKDDAEYLEKLYEKLTEEIQEFKETPSVDEFSDIMEVLESIAKFHGFHLNTIKEVKGKKKLERGSFDNRIILEES
jgi:predicted house-cleaning noncanonical NTP pyrophosphatase (MazG superfamily)